MKRHETPKDLAVALSRHAPRKIRAILDPAVGTGNLIAPLLNRINRNNSRVYCVDSDLDAIHIVAKSYRDALPPSAKFIHSDFLAWSRKPRRPKFDCIVMNPPFAATKAKLHRLEWLEPDSRNEKITRHVPLEAAFVHRAIELLEERGRLLAILPCSVVMADSLQWLRNEMLSIGAIWFVHELPPRSFPGVESRMYLMVFEKGAKQKEIALLNHDLREPERLALSVEDCRATRLDFGFVNATNNLRQLRKHSWLKWMRLGEVADVLRGDIASPRGPRCVVHSTDYFDGFWHVAERHDISVVGRLERRVRRGDLLMSRVGRNAFRTIGRGQGITGMSCSDCVTIVRPKKAHLALDILFSLRVILSQEWSRALIERGTGASYVSHNCLLDLPIPMGACTRYAGQFRKFVKAERNHLANHTRYSVKVVAERLGDLLD